jgi:hypothetical protein
MAKARYSSEPYFDGCPGCGGDPIRGALWCQNCAMDAARHNQVLQGQPTDQQRNPLIHVTFTREPDGIQFFEDRRDFVVPLVFNP